MYACFPHCRAPRPCLALLFDSRRWFLACFPSDLRGPVSVGCASAYVERHPELDLPRMCIIAHDPPMTDEAIESFLEFLDQVLTEDGEPFSVLWNVRGDAFPSLKQFRRVIAWLDDNDRTANWDRLVQGNVAVIRKPLLRAGAKLMVSIAKPPQPSFVCSDEEGAFAWARDHCKEARSWST